MQAVSDAPSVHARLDLIVARADACLAGIARRERVAQRIGAQRRRDHALARWT